MYLKNCISFDTHTRINNIYVLDNGMKWDLVWTTRGAYDKSFNRVLSITQRLQCLTNEYEYKITMTRYCGLINSCINLYRIPRTFLTAYFDTDIVFQDMRWNLAIMYRHIRSEYNVDIFSAILDLFACLVITDYSLYKCAN